MKCLECGFKAKNSNSLGVHISRKHNTKKYYDKYFKKETEGSCAYCGNKTKFVSLSEGYRDFCSKRCASAGTVDKRKYYFIKKYGVDNPSKLQYVKDKKANTCNEHFGFDNPSKVPEIKDKKANTCNEHFGFDNPSKVPEIKDKKIETAREHFGVDYPTKSNIVQQQTKEYCLKKYHTTHFLQYYRNKNNICSKPEKYFIKLLKKNNYRFKKEYFIVNHNFDFAIFKNDKLKCIVEIDGEFYHGLKCDCDGKKFLYSIYKNDFDRYSLVPDKVKFLVIDSKRLDEGFKELKRILRMKYKDWKKEMLRSIPKDIEDAIPKFDKKRMLKDWDKLCSESYNEGSFIGNSILLNFCKSRIVEAIGSEWKSLRKTLYKSPCSSHHLLEGFEIFKNPSKLREKFRKKYEGVKEVIVKHHSPEKMLAVCSLGKTYISKEPIDKESKRIIKFLNLNVQEI